MASVALSSIRNPKKTTQSTQVAVVDCLASSGATYLEVVTTKYDNDDSTMTIRYEKND